jgi:lipopolysaccharide transport system permease protein
MVTYFFVFGIVLRTRFAHDPSRSGFVLYFLAGMVPWLAFSEAAGLVTEVFALGIFAIGLLLARGGVPLSVLWLPVLVIPQLLFTLGVYVRDLGQVNGFLLTLWFFLIPICYPVESLPAGAMPVLSKNPLFVLVTAYRAIFLERHPPAFHSMWKLWLGSALLCLVGHAWFYKLKKNFADVI